MLETEIKKILEEDEKRIAILEGKKILVTPNSRIWYRPGSTVEKIILLINNGFFNNPCTISQIILELKTKDFHLKSSDLTLPLRRIVHKGLLKRTKGKVNGSLSKNWLYVKV